MSRRRVLDCPASTRWWFWATLGSFVLSLAVPFFNDSRYADISNRSTDHLHHAYATWIFLFRGLDLYRKTFSECWPGIEYPHAIHAWGHMPMAYPPGVFAVFLPPAILGRYVPMSHHAFAVATMTYVLALAHMALFAVFRALTALPRGGRFLVGIVAWLMILRVALQGFYDPIWIGCGAMMVVRLREHNPTSALRWATAAAFVHFRAAALIPLGLLAVVELYGALRGVEFRKWPLGTLAVLGIVCASAVGAFVLMYPATASYRASHAPVSSFLGTGLFVGLVTMSAAALIVQIIAKEWMGAATLALCALFALFDFNGYIGFWHHATLGLAAPLAVGVRGPGRFTSAARQAALAWLLAIHPLVWGGNAFDSVSLVVNEFRLKR